MKNFINYVSYIPKQAVTSLAIFVLLLSAIAAPAIGSGVLAQDNEVRLEADTKVMNLNDNTGYQASVDAMVDDVIQVQVWFHNMEDAEGPSAENLRVAIDVPTQPGANQTITSTVNADNADAVTSSANVNLSLDDAWLEYIGYGEGVDEHSGGVQHRYNQGAEEGRDECLTGNDPAGPADDCYTSVNLGEAGDAIVDGGIVIDENFKPSFEFQSTLTILLRVKGEAVKVNKYVRNVTTGEEDWQLKNEARPEDVLEYMIRFENKGNTTLESVSVGDNLPDYIAYVPGSTIIINGNNPDGIDAESDNVWQGGIRVGDYAPGAAGYVIFRAQVDPVNVFEQCGTYTLKNVGVVRPEGMNEFYNTAHTDVKIICEEPEKPEEPEEPEKPEKPEEEEDMPEVLPEAGIGGILGGLFGSAGLGIGIRNWLSSRRKLLASLLEA